MISNKNKRVQITMPKDLYILIRKLSKDNNITISSLVNITIIDYLDKSIKNKEKGDHKNEENI